MRSMVLALATVLASAGFAAAQRISPCPPPRSLSLAADTTKADIAIIARVQADELRFTSQPNASLQIFGCPQVDTSRVVLRTNLPTPVQPGVTYRNVIVDFRLKMKFAELECMLAGRPCVRADSARADTTRIR